MMIKTDIFCGSRMRSARYVNGLSLDDLVTTTNIEKKKLWCFEVGKLFPTRGEEKVIAKSLNVEPVFFYWTDTSPLTEDCINFSPRMRRL